MSFSYEDNLRLCEALKCKFNLTVTVNRNGYNKDGSIAYSIYIHSHSMSDLRRIVRPYFVDSMLYKLK